jgi:hypothetical protein
MNSNTQSIFEEIELSPVTILVKLSKQVSSWGLFRVMRLILGTVILYIIIPYHVKKTMEKLFEADFTISITISFPEKRQKTMSKKSLLT